LGKEIERKFLVTDQTWKKLGNGTAYRQGYLSTRKERVVRVRTMGGKAALTIKGPIVGVTRPEFEYEIPLDEANQLLELCEKPLIEKTRFRIDHGGLVWEVDEFHGLNEGLIIAECELESENQEIDKPEWVGTEVTGDPRYANTNLVARPFTVW